MTEQLSSCAYSFTVFLLPENLISQSSSTCRTPWDRESIKPFFLCSILPLSRLTCLLILFTHLLWLGCPAGFTSNFLECFHRSCLVHISFSYYFSFQITNVRKIDHSRMIRKRFILIFLLLPHKFLVFSLDCHDSFFINLFWEIFSIVCCS